MPRKHGTSCFQGTHRRSGKRVYKSPSTRARNRLRLERFLAKKKASTVPASSSPEPDCGSYPLESPGIAPNQTDGKGRTSSEINLTTTSQASEGQRLVLNGSRSKRISEIQQAEANALKCALHIVQPCEMTWRNTRNSTAHWRRVRPRLQLFTRRKNEKE